MKWKTLRHNGVAFPPDYDYRGLTIKIKGQPLHLDSEEKDRLIEEMLMAWAKKKDTAYVLDPVFQANFLGDLKQVLPAAFADLALADIDWTEMHAIVDREKTANLPPEEKKARAAERKAVREKLQAQYGRALVDEVETEIGAYMVEPPGILMGRGAHPLRGKWKGRLFPEDVTLHVDKDCPVPPAPEGHHWGKIVNDPDSMWVASWFDALSQKRKYVWLADSSSLRQERDKAKYVKATKLEAGLERVRDKIRAGMNYEDKRGRAPVESLQARVHARIEALQPKMLEANEQGNAARRKRLEEQLTALQEEKKKLDAQWDKVHAAEMKTRQIATVCYLIDRLAMRVGDEKDEDEADTVGASTLRVEHVHIHRDHIEFDFLGKDSVQWHKSLPLSASDTVLARNLVDFVNGKQPGEQIFDQIGSAHVNKFLSGIVPGLSAKVFRTYHATTTVRNYLGKKGRFSETTPLFEKEYVAKLANLEAAMTCNHKRTPPKNWEQSLANRQAALEKLKATEPATDQAAARLKERIAKATRQLELAQQTRDYNLGTSLKNYIDPRVYKAWGDHVGFDWKRLYTKSLQRKFAWVERSRLRWNASGRFEEVSAESASDEAEPPSS